MKQRAGGCISTGIFVLAAFIAGVWIGQSGLTALVGLGSASSTPQEARASFQPMWEVWTFANNSYFDQPLDNDLLAEGAINGMLETLGDRNTIYLPPEEESLARQESEGEIQGIGAEVESIDGFVTIVSPIDGSPAEAAGLQPGDIILSADGTILTDMNIGDAAAIVRGPAGTPVLLEIEREGEAFEIEIIRDRIKIASARGEMLPDNIAYVRLSRFAEPTADEMLEVLEPLLAQNPVGLIIDVRNNPGGSLTTVVDIADEFLDGGLILTERYGDGNEDIFNATSSGVAQEIPMVVLINEGSASASEVLAGAIRDQDRGVLIGTVSFGKGTVQQWRGLTNGGGVRLTVARWLTPDGTWVHEEGIVPDFYIPGQENRTDPDLQLDGAVDYLLGREVQNVEAVPEPEAVESSSQ